MTVEKTLENKLRNRVKKLGGIAIKLISPSLTGLPDRLVLLPGARIYFVELKSTGRKLSPMQVIVHKILIRLGFNPYVIDSEDLLNGFFKLIDP
jgi:hypothetical protein